MVSPGMTEQTSKNPLINLHVSDLRGIAQLATLATQGVARIVEGVHHSVWQRMGIPTGKAPGQTRGITGLVYKNIHAVTHLFGTGVDVLLAELQDLFAATNDNEVESSKREAALALLNGLMGDRLHASNNPFAGAMSFRCRDQALNWQNSPAMPAASGKVLLMIHGLCLNDNHWRKDDAPGHAEALAAQLGYTTVFLRYNSGQHISQNGRELAAQLEHLVAHWPTQIKELSIVAHSMGGLLARSAVHYAQEGDLLWPEQLKNLVFLGTPHHGAPLERGGNWLDLILSSTSFTRPFTALGRLRSAGITDLRYGHVVDEDWQGQDRFELKPDTRLVVPLPGHVACYTVAATIISSRGSLAERLGGDGLVPLHSALGQHDNKERQLQFDEASQFIAHNTNHMELLSSPEVTRQLLHWLKPGRALSQ